MLDGKLKFNTREGLSRPTKHKNVIEPGDLLHFISRGLDFHQQISLNSFHFNTALMEQNM